MRQALLGSLGDFKNGVNFQSSQMGSGLPLINVKDITDSRLIDSRNLNLVDVKIGDDLLAREGDIFFVRSSVKLSGIALAAMLKSSERPAVHCGFVIRFRSTSPDVDPEFLLYLLGSPEYRERLKNLSGGAAIVNISQTALKSLEVSIPPIGTQQTIAELLSTYDDLIENNRRRMALLEESARLLYREWFVRLRFPGYEHTPIVDGVPQGWERKTLGEVTHINQRNIANTFDGEIEYIDIASVTPNSVNETTTYEFRDAPGRARRVVRHGDIIWSCVRPNRRSHAVIWQPAENLVASTGFVVISPKSLPTSFLYQAVTTDLFVGYLENHAKGAAYPAVVSGDFERATILAPTSALTTAFNDFAEPLLHQTQNLRLQNEKLRAARDLLLPRLMSGELAV